MQFQKTPKNPARVPVTTRILAWPGIVTMVLDLVPPAGSMPGPAQVLSSLTLTPQEATYLAEALCRAAADASGSVG